VDVKTLFLIIIYSILIQNFILSRFLGLCPFFGCSQKTSSAVGMGLAVTFVMVLASAMTWMVYTYLLDPATSIIGLFTAGKEAPNLTFLRTISFILVIAFLVQLIEMFLQKKIPALYRALGIYLPLLATNCAILGVAVLNIEGFSSIGIHTKLSFIQSIAQGAAGGVGFLLILILMAGLREKLDLGTVPESMKGVPVACITGGLMALAFMGFTGLSF
jgi:electron transport complex protein RnfA